MMNGSQGFYSLVQYSEFPERAEFVNVGIVLFAEEHPRVQFRFAGSSKRVDRAFNVVAGSQFFALLKSLENRLGTEFGGDWHREAVEKFIGMRSGKLRLAPPRSVLVKDPKATLDELFEKLVSDIPRASRRIKAATQLRNELIVRGVESLLDHRPEPVVLPQGVTIKAPYGYQNGSYNLINGVSLREDPDSAIEKASTYAIEGSWLYKGTATAEQKRLIVVADVEGQRPAFVEAVFNMMEEHKVKFYTLSDMEPLVADIRKNVLIN
ncbi:DUF3037 domain-containing protein [Mesorhizobium sp. M8A.F.Ca.ET.165.01.1.1]|uniref:DUF3037 domain-containing protein n=1 Tax=Mesorhizobium sp. M8A.F.Ca.ET.165.01.1.1 TaxID=2563960 RepID=UPI001093AE90|nr:DUF3037 domain-containing protein [Mesorhizobium sp. M8A.F.Ca.ET.165.01.1.1]TGT35714.1 DUF3037 domain-containing protein [Mesorhizobium sp. M8A.F.Ca.ET.165.01.1.1]